jgi:hypothetical protein
VAPPPSPLHVASLTAVHPTPATVHPRPPLPTATSRYDNPWLPGTPLTASEKHLTVPEYLRHFDMTVEEYESRFPHIYRY